MTLVFTAGATPASAAKGATCAVTNTDSGRTFARLQQAVEAAKPGARLVVKGTCVGGTFIDKDIAIRGARTHRWGKPILDGEGRTRLLRVTRVATVSLMDLTIQNGWSKWYCGGIDNEGTLTLRDVVVRHNRARLEGGGICNSGSLRLTGATRVTANTARKYRHGGIWNRQGTLVMDDVSSVTGNRAGLSMVVHGEGAGLGAGVGNLGTMVMNGASKVSGNRGNGVHIGCGSTLTMNDSSSISGNTAVATAGGVWTRGTLSMNDSASISGNRVIEDGCFYAAGVVVAGRGPGCTASLTMTGSSIISDNHAECSTGGLSNGVYFPDGSISADGQSGTLDGVNCAPQTLANVYGNTPTDCRLP